MSPLVRFALFVALPLLPGCGLYTMENECEPRPDEGSEIDGDLAGVVVADDGKLKTTKAMDAGKLSPGDEVTLEIGRATLTFRRPPTTGAGVHRLEDLDGRLCDLGKCTPQRGALEVVVWEDDGIDATLRPDEEPIERGRPALRGSARILFRRWQHEVCTPRRKGSDSAFAVRY